MLNRVLIFFLVLNVLFVNKSNMEVVLPMLESSFGYFDEFSEGMKEVLESMVEDHVMIFSIQELSGVTLVQFSSLLLGYFDKPFECFFSSCDPPPEYKG